MSSPAAVPSAAAALSASGSIFLQAPRATRSDAASRLVAMVRTAVFIGIPRKKRGGEPRSVQLQEFDVEDQGGVRGNATRGAIAAVGEFGRDPEAVLGTHRHQLQALGPACDHLAEAEGRRIVALVGTVEDAAVEQLALVVHAHLRISGRARTRAL